MEGEGGSCIKQTTHVELDSPPGYTALGPAELGAVYPGALLAHRPLFGPIYLHSLTCVICILLNRIVLSFIGNTGQ